MLRTETPEIEERRMKLQLRLAKMEEVEGCQEDFLRYVRNVWPEFIAGAHHRMIAKYEIGICKLPPSVLDHWT